MDFLQSFFPDTSILTGTIITKVSSPAPFITVQTKKSLHLQNGVYGVQISSGSCRCNSLFYYNKEDASAVDSFLFTLYPLKSKKLTCGQNIKIEVFFFIRDSHTFKNREEEFFQFKKDIKQMKKNFFNMYLSLGSFLQYS